MFIIAQLIGLFVIHTYSPEAVPVFNETSGTYDIIIISPDLKVGPFDFTPPELKTEFEFWLVLPQILIAFVLAIFLVLLFSKIKAKLLIRLWFFIVYLLGLSIVFNAFFKDILPYSSYLVILIALPLVFIKVFRQEIIVHNLTELLIYPGIAVILVQILNIWTAIIILILISIYDIWAVWHTGFMQKMAKFQINEVKVFAGFFIPYVSKKVKEQLKKLPKSKLKKKKIRVNLAILGGGDVIFPIITAGVILMGAATNKLPSFFAEFATPFLGIPGLATALLVSLGATLAVLYLFLFAEKGKAYPAMPYITIGIFAAMILAKLIF
ncbi:MAG: hypothetical protein KKF56_04075 [Nanoarchaeota archaeon]|nr:hypothetical protein [Nanoarchaeota archaeon]